MSTFSTFERFERQLDRLGQFRMVPGLDRIGKALNGLGLNKRIHAAVQVVGTNGKGSTATFVESLARAHGLKTGLYTSPHFVTVRERIKVNGLMLSEEQWLGAANATGDMAAECELTYFEWLTLMAAWLFREAGIDCAVIEAGLGGTYDATTALQADLVVITPVGLDHQRVLGDSLGAIAKDKAGAMRPSRPAMSAVQADEAARALGAAAADKGVPFARVDERFRWQGGGVVDVRDGHPFLDQVRLGLRGPHQRDNALLALAAWTELAAREGWSNDPRFCRQGLERAWLPGRLQQVPGRPRFILDGAHNPDGLRVLKQALQDMDTRPGVVVFSCLKDKDVQAMCRELLALDPERILVPELAQNERSLPSAYLAWIMGHGAEAVSGVEQVFSLVQDCDAPVLVCGSLFLLAEFFRLRPEWLEGGVEHGFRLGTRNGGNG